MSAAPAPATVDRESCELVGRLIATAVGAHMRWRPGNDGVFEALNALAATAAVVIRGTGEDAAKVRAWFDGALDQQLIGEVQGHG